MSIASRLSALPGAESRRFFMSHGLGPAYASAGEFASRADKVNAALDAAEREGRLDPILLAANRLLTRDVLGRKEAGVPEAVSKPVGGRLFISHAASDRPLTDAVVDFLVLAGVPRDRIFYTSQRSTGIATGAQFGLVLREAMRDASVVIALLTETYVTRPYCLAELGAQWVLQLPSFPIAVDPVTPSQVAGVLAGVQVASLDGDSMSELHDVIAAELQLDLPVAAWNRAQQRFLDSVPDLLAQLPTAPVVARDEYERVLQLLDQGPRRESMQAEEDDPLDELLRPLKLSQVVLAGPSSRLAPDSPAGEWPDLLARAASLWPTARADDVTISKPDRDRLLGVLDQGLLDETARRLVATRGALLGSATWHPDRNGQSDRRAQYHAQWPDSGATAVMMRAAVLLPEAPFAQSLCVISEIQFRFDLLSELIISSARNRVGTVGTLRLSMGELIDALAVCLITASRLIPEAVLSPLLRGMPVAASMELHLSALSQPRHSPAGNDLSQVIDLDPLGDPTSDPRQQLAWADSGPMPADLVHAREVVIDALRQVALQWGYLDPEPGLARLRHPATE